MKEKRQLSVPALGGSSLLVIFAALSLTVFALLSLSTVLAQKRMADASVEAVSGYYAADLEAERIFARLKTGETVEGVASDGTHFWYSCPISENQTLEVELERTAQDWHICRWQVVARSEPVSEVLPVWQGNGDLS